MGLFNDSYDAARAVQHMKKAKEERAKREQQKAAAANKAKQNAGKSEADRLNEDNPFV